MVDHHVARRAHQNPLPVHAAPPRFVALAPVPEAPVAPLPVLLVVRVVPLMNQIVHQGRARDGLPRSGGPLQQGQFPLQDLLDRLLLTEVELGQVRNVRQQILLNHAVLHPLRVANAAEEVFGQTAGQPRTVGVGQQIQALHEPVVGY